MPAATSAVAAVRLRVFFFVVFFLAAAAGKRSAKKISYQGGQDSGGNARSIESLSSHAMLKALLSQRLAARRREHHARRRMDHSKCDIKSLGYDDDNCDDNDGCRDEGGDGNNRNHLQEHECIFVSEWDGCDSRADHCDVLPSAHYSNWNEARCPNDGKLQFECHDDKGYHTVLCCNPQPRHR